MSLEDAQKVRPARSCSVLVILQHPSVHHVRTPDNFKCVAGSQPHVRSKTLWLAPHLRTEWDTHPTVFHKSIRLSRRHLQVKNIRYFHIARVAVPFRGTRLFSPWWASPMLWTGFSVVFLTCASSRRFRNGQMRIRALEFGRHECPFVMNVAE